MTRGIERYTSSAGFPVIRVHYTADPEKDPANPAGAEWLAHASNAIVGGLNSAQWRAEMEIDWGATGGELVFPQFHPFQNKIVVEPHEIPESWRVFGSFDYGHRNPSAFYFHAIDHDGTVHTVWEYYRAQSGYRDTARAIRASGFFPRLSYLPVADPSLWGETQQTENEVKSVAQLFFELPDAERIVFAKGKAGGDVTFAEKINGEFWKDLGAREPRWKIHKTCPKLIWELGKLRFSDWSAVQMQTHNLREQIVDRDNHGFDACKYFFTMFFQGAPKPEEEKYSALKKSDPLAYEEWQRIQDMFKPRDTMHSLFGG